MTEPVFSRLEECFGELPDPRVQGCCDHKLIDLIIITVCAVICGADSWTGVERFAKAKASWLKQYLELPNGIPSHDTFGRVFASLNAEAFQAGFSRWVAAVVFRVTKGQVVAIDGKTVRRSHGRTIGQDAIHMVSAWASQNGIALGQRTVDDKSNEITATPELLRLLDVSGCIVTIDAMGCQTDIAQAIRDAKADYVLRVKDNQSNLRQDLKTGLSTVASRRSRTWRWTINKLSTSPTDTLKIGAVEPSLTPSRLNTFATPTPGPTCRPSCGCSVSVAYKSTVETAYYISSLPHDAVRLLHATRHHWAIENSFHWVLDHLSGR